MIKRNNKKGFTIVELVIVIAVIAILAAVLIPTFSGIIKKAQESSDTQLAKNFNTSLAADEAINGKPATFAAVLNVLSESGYNIEKLNPTADGNWFAWDEVTNQILYLDAEYNVISSAKDLDASADSIDDDKWHFAVDDAESFAIIAQKTDKVYFVGMNLTKGDNATIDLTGVEISKNVSTATPIAVTTGAVLNIKGGTVTATGEVVGAANKVYSISIEVEGGELNLNGTTLSGKTADGKHSTPISMYAGATGTLENVTCTSDGGTPIEIGGGSNVNIIGGEYSTNYRYGSLFVSGYTSNSIEKATTVTVKNTALKLTGTTEYLLTLYGSEKGAEVVLDGVTVTYENEPSKALIWLHEKATLTIKNGTTFNGKTLTIDDWKAMYPSAKSITETDGVIVITNK